MWSMFNCWNQSLLNKPEREPKKRDYVYASEIGKPFIDRYLRMTGVTPTNPPSDRAKRKFEGGNFFQGLVSLVLFRAGLWLDEEIPLEYTYPGLLRISGRADLKGGGKPDWEKVKAEIDADITLQRFPFIVRTAKAVTEHFAQEYPDGLPTQLFEIKSASLFMFERYDKAQKVDPHHKLQAYVYLKADPSVKNINIFYVCRDDLRSLEAAIIRNPTTETELKTDIQTMTDYFNSQKRPPLEVEVIYNSDQTRFASNWKVEYSQYLTMLYGYKHQEEFREKYQPLISRWNRVLNRAVKGDSLTANNLKVIDEIKVHGFDFNEILENAKSKTDTDTNDDDI